MDATTSAICALIRGGPPPERWRPHDWQRLVAAARGQGVEGLLQRALAATGWPPEMPPEARAALRECVYESTGHNMRAYGTLAAVLGAVGRRAPIVVLKGAALGARLYPSPGLRPISDLDLLVPAEAVGDIAATLAELGFGPRPHMAPELARAIEPHIALIGGPTGAVPVDLHWALLAGSADWRGAPLGWFRQRTEPWRPPAAYFTAGGPPDAALQLTPTASLLYQCAHLVLQHGQDPVRLIWVYDLHLLASAAVDWDDLAAQARRLGWGEVVRIALGQARQCFGTALEPAVLDALRGPLDRRVRFRGVDAADAQGYDTWNTLAGLSLPTRLRFFVRVVLPSRAWLRANYEPGWGPWWPLAYPYRWLKPLRGLAARLARIPQAGGRRIAP